MLPCRSGCSADRCRRAVLDVLVIDAAASSFSPPRCAALCVVLLPAMRCFVRCVSLDDLVPTLPRCACYNTETLVDAAASSLVDAAASPLVDAAASPLVDAAASPLVDAAASPLVDAAASSLVDAAASPLVDAAALISPFDAAALIYSMLWHLVSCSFT